MLDYVPWLSDFIHLIIMYICFIVNHLYTLPSLLKLKILVTKFQNVFRFLLQTKVYQNSRYNKSNN